MFAARGGNDDEEEEEELECHALRAYSEFEDPTRKNMRRETKSAIFHNPLDVTSGYLKGDSKLEKEDESTRPPLLRSAEMAPAEVKKEWSILHQITINVSGRKFLIYKEFLQQYPTTLLGSADLEKYYDKERDDYFFDRNREAFESIFDFYLYGKLYPPMEVPEDIYRDNVDFFRIMSAFNEAEKVNEAEIAIEEEALKKKQETQNPICKARDKLEGILDNPGASKPGMFWGWLDIFFIFLSILCMLVETIPDVEKEVEIKGSTAAKISFILETVTVVFFTFDVLMRYIVTHEKMEFSKAPTTWLDIATVAPYFFELFIDVSDMKSLKILRIARIMRILKLVKKNKRLLLIVRVMSQSTEELKLLIVVWAICIIVAGNLMFYAEDGNNPDVFSICDTMWWAIVTMSTVGYGDIVPRTAVGKFIASCFAYVSMIFLALPLTIIVSQFSKQYDNKQTTSIDKKTQDADDNATD